MKKFAAVIFAVIAITLMGCTATPDTAKQTQPRGAFGGGSRVTLAESAARTAAFTGTGVDLGSATTITLQLDVTAVTGTTPTLDVKVQTLIDGTNWCDIAAFTQRTVGTSRQVIRISAIPATPQAEVACTDGTLAAGTVHQGSFGQQLRVKHALPGGTTPSYTYSIIGWLGN